MTAAPVFSITRNGNPIASVALGNGNGHEEILPVTELQEHGFELEHREEDTEYGIWLGDIEAGQAPTRNDQSASTVGIARSRFVYWDDAFYFEGARGVVSVKLRSRPSLKQEPWQDRAAVAVLVTSSKLSQERYESMLTQMSRLAAGLVLDLISKSARSTKFSLLSPHTRIRTSAVELRILETTWPVVAASLEQIARRPATRLSRESHTRSCWGSERLETGSLLSLARNGIDPRTDPTSLPFQAQVPRMKENVDTFEHRVISGMLDLLLSRTRDCHSNLMRHILALKQDRVWRDRPVRGGRSLFATEDVPRLEQLEQRRTQARALIKQLMQARRMEPFTNLKGRLDLTQTPVFANVEPYRKIRHQMIRFLRSGLVIVEEGIEERIKSTSRLYEQWVFLQIVAAFRSAGLSCASQLGILHSSQKFRFTLDLDRGARATFVAPDGRSVIVRYEPWVKPRESAVQNRDSVYRGTTGANAWSPDILIEFLTNPSEVGTAPRIEYGVIVDAKYTRVIRDDHWNSTSKYLEIRATGTDAQIIRQQWLAFPGTQSHSEEPIQLRDSSKKWLRDGPNCPKNETIQGTLALTPPKTTGDHQVAEGWIQQPESSTRSFVHGLLRYLQYRLPKLEKGDDGR